MQAKQVGVCGEDCVGDDSDNDRDRACLLESDKYVKKGLRLDLAPRILPSVACLLPMPSWFGKSPKRMATLSATGGGMMIGLGGILLLTGNKH